MSSCPPPTRWPSTRSAPACWCYEVPAGFQDFSISYQEMFSDDSYGDTFFVFFTAEPQEGTDSGAPAAV